MRLKAMTEESISSFEQNRESYHGFRFPVLSNRQRLNEAGVAQIFSVLTLGQHCLLEARSVLQIRFCKNKLHLI